MEATAFYILMSVLVWSPLSFGAVPVAAHGLMSLGVFVATLLLLLTNVGKDRTGTWKIRYPVTSMSLLFLLLLFYLLFLLVPLPEPVLKFLSPEAWVVAQKSFPASQAVMEQGPIRSWSSITGYSHPVQVSLILWVTYGLFFFGFSMVLNTKKRIEAAIMIILILGCFEAIYGMVQTYSADHKIWWHQKMIHMADVTGTYVNRNHFAGLMEMITIIAVLYAAALSERRKKPSASFNRKIHLRARLSELFSGEQRFNKIAFVLFAGVVTGIGLIFSGSRGGMIAIAAGLLAIALFFLLSRGHRIKGLLVMILFVIISIYALAIGIEYPVSRFQSFDADFGERARFAQRAYMIFKDYPLAGIGIGNHQYVYPKYQADVDTKSGIVHAHNDWVQFLAEGGLLGLILALGGILYHLYRSFRHWRKRHDPFAVCLGIAPFAALTAIGIHSWSDFNLHIPANFLMLAAVATLGYSAIHLEDRHHVEKYLLPHNVLPLKYKGFVLLIPLILAMSWCGVRAFRHGAADLLYGTLDLSGSSNTAAEAVDTLQSTTRWEPANGDYLFQLSLALIKMRDLQAIDPDRGQEQEEQAQRPLQLRIVRTLEDAIRLNPFHEEAHIRLAWEYARFWLEPDAKTRWVPAADLSMERGAYFAGENNPYLHIWMGDYWLMRSKTVSPSSSQWENTLAKARWHYQKNLSLETGSDRNRMLEHIRRNVWAHYPDREFVKRMLEEE